MPHDWDFLQVSKRFNLACQNVLNQGFSRVDKFHAKCQREVRTQLPRRESERRNHPLARHVDILAAIETRLSLLHMTFMKYIDMGLCCFIPGKVGFVDPPLNFYFFCYLYDVVIH